MMMMMMMMHECDRGTVLEDQWEWGGKKERILRGEKD
jgi:hypothetical protein